MLDMNTEQLERAQLAMGGAWRRRVERMIIVLFGLIAAHVASGSAVA